MDIRNALREVKALRPVSAALFFAPTVVFFILSVAHDFFYAWPFQPYAVIWWSLGVVALTSALVEIDKVTTDRLVGCGGPPMGTRFFSLAFLSVNINGGLTVIGLLPYALIRAFIRTT